MKTTIELPDRLLREAKAAAVRRRTPLKAIITHALEREVRAAEPAVPRGFVVDDDGLPCPPARGARVTSLLVNQLMAEKDVWPCLMSTS